MTVNNNHERRFMSFVKGWYAQAKALEIGTPPYCVICVETKTGKTVFESKVIGIKDGVLQLEKPFTNAENFNSVEITLHYGQDGNFGVMGRPQILDLRQ